MSANRLMALLWLLVSAGLLVMPLLGVDATTRLYYSNAGQVLVTLVSSLYCFATMRAFPAQSPRHFLVTWAEQARSGEDLSRPICRRHRRWASAISRNAWIAFGAEGKSP